MLQRIQSLFLLVAMLANLSVLILPVWSFTTGNNAETLTALSIDGETSQGGDEAFLAFDHTETFKLVMHVSALGLSIVSGILLLVTIFLYNNRARQKSLSYVNIILSMLMLVCLTVLTRTGPTLLVDQGNEGNAGIGFFMPVVAIIMIWVAIQRIQKDDDLVNSLDRIR